jgi:hypothetical protein
MKMRKTKLIKEKKHIVLDIDGTLIHDCSDPDDIDDYKNIYTRPYLKQFFDFCFKEYETVSIWSANPKKRIEGIISHCFKKLLPKDKKFFDIFDIKKCVKVYPPTMNMGRSQNVDKPYGYVVKPLRKFWKKHKKIGMNKTNVFIIDNTKSTYERNYGNAIPINTWEYKDKKDKELKKFNLLY